MTEIKQVILVGIFKLNHYDHKMHKLLQKVNKRLFLNFCIKSKHKPQLSRLFWWVIKHEQLGDLNCIIITAKYKNLIIKIEIHAIK